jgi:FkbH-like protein
MKLAVISDITFEPILKQMGKNADFSIQTYVYSDQIVSELIKPDLILDEVDVLIIHFDSFFYRYTDAYITEILTAVNTLSARFSGNILLSNNLANGRHGSILKTNIGQQEQVIIELDKEVRGILQTTNVYFYDVKKLMTRIGQHNAYNFKLGFLYQMPYTKDFISLLSSELTSFVNFLSAPEKKAIFVDCDNTLWNGILGEDGLEGIQCDRNAKGVLFFQFQEFLLEKKKEGFILGLCSKNNETDVKEAFEKLNMPLTWDDFLIRKINWLNKSENLKEAATELNIGVDSLIFIDDNDFELRSVSTLTPEVKTLKLTDDYPSFLILCDSYFFKRKRLTREDLEKNEQYLAEQLRNNIKANVQSFEDYLESLAIKLDITINNSTDLVRLTQLTEKTNQFNFNKEPFSIPALEKFIAANNLVYGLRVSDKFGDYGLVGLILMEVQQKQATLRNFLLSCRALGRLIEDDFLNYVLNDLNERGIELHEIVFKETPKNAPARTFFEKFKKTKTSAGYSPIAHR